MARGKSEYCLQLNCSVEEADKYIQSWLEYVELKEKFYDGNKYYITSITDLIAYKRLVFEYCFSGNTLIVRAWLGNYTNPISLYGIYAYARADLYKVGLMNIFEELSADGKVLIKKPDGTTENINIENMVDEAKRQGPIRIASILAAISAAPFLLGALFAPFISLPLIIVAIIICVVSFRDKKCRIISGFGLGFLLLDLLLCIGRTIVLLNL